MSDFQVAKSKYKMKILFFCGNARRPAQNCFHIVSLRGLFCFHEPFVVKIPFWVLTITFSKIKRYQ